MNEEYYLQFIEKAIEWVISQRDKYRLNARPLSSYEMQKMARFFPIATFFNVKIIEVPIIENPPFYSKLQNVEIPHTIDYSKMQGITFVDTILISQARYPKAHEWLPLIFHELVHVVQYQLLGIDVFVEQYIKGFIEQGFRYENIFLESHAYELQNRYMTAPSMSFPVVEEVRRNLDIS